MSFEVAQGSPSRGQQQRLPGQVACGDQRMVAPEQAEHFAAHVRGSVGRTDDVLCRIVHPIEPHVGDDGERVAVACIDRADIDVSARRDAWKHAPIVAGNLTISRELPIIWHDSRQGFERPATAPGGQNAALLGSPR